MPNKSTKTRTKEKKGQCKEVHECNRINPMIITYQAQYEHKHVFIANQILL